MSSRSSSAMLVVRSAMKTTSMGLGRVSPHEPRQAEDATDPVDPFSRPMIGAKSKSTSLESVTRIVLHRAVTGHGTEQILVLHRTWAVEYVPGSHVAGILPGRHLLAGTGGGHDAEELVPLLLRTRLERAPHSILIWLVLDSVRLDDNALPIGVSHACW